VVGLLNGLMRRRTKPVTRAQDRADGEDRP
jgi:hypothetical protein